jgi:transcriptional regulator with XRE-family HTH domain
MTFELHIMSYLPMMGELSKQEIAALVKEGRTAKGYTQQELADLAHLSLRSVQRIENGEVLPRSYTLRMLSEHLNFSINRPAGKTQSPVTEHEPTIVEPNTSHSAAVTPGKARKLILTFSSGILLLLLTGAFLSQSARFPETDFERLLLWSLVLGIYSIALLRIWK